MDSLRRRAAVRQFARRLWDDAGGQPDPLALLSRAQREATVFASANWAARSGAATIDPWTILLIISVCVKLWQLWRDWNSPDEHSEATEEALEGMLP